MYYKLESLRGVAACLVVLFHSPYHFGTEPLQFLHNSYLFVDFFFVLSGFVMAFSYSEKIGRTLTFKPYIQLRLGRIYPLHLFMLVACIGYFVLKQGLFMFGYGNTDLYQGDELYTILTNLLLLQAAGANDALSWNTPSWSIGAEFFAYMAFYGFLITIDRHKGLWVPPVISLVCYGFILSQGRPNLDITYDYGVIRCLGAFYLGVWVFRLNAFEATHRWISHHIGKLEWLLAIATVAIVTVAEEHIYLSLTAIGIFTLSILVFANPANGTLGQVLNSQPLRLVGQWSYSIYMLHYLIILVFNNVIAALIPAEAVLTGPPSLLLNTLIVLLTLAGSYLTFEQVEKRYRDKVKAYVKQRRQAEQSRVNTEVG
ncbi:acyltransferase family protein [Ferrimonas kyonanensis]|uniref:acyltransferase family protein n=1 Tax=Ferrimonas kyonanensis TaxID=364763 RepID=UPI000410DE1E|nr:acyltransferase [Ferrimonas kyonanensis]